MAGHSQFANIKHRKGAQDAKRAQKFTKLIREIIVATKQGLPDPEFNSRLRSAIITAKKENLPKDRIDAAIKTASGNNQHDNFEEVVYEGYGPGNIALIIQTLTNNRNRTAAELRHALSKYNGKLGESGSVSFLFNHVGLIAYKASSINSFDTLFNTAIELQALDVEENDYDEEKMYYVTCNIQDFGNVRDQLFKKFSDAEFSRLFWKPINITTIDDEELQKRILNLMDVLENNDDVQHVDSNFIFNTKI
ncbi:putative transcriptional regulatory protein [Ehrlichia ruminantium]|uniref:Probable transcriptional regulatory protein ERGA_CDS_03720 n=2 Tax=Ehrlichia ruminantium TaxID=779 RepID=Y372_EHRRG|nr:YebC/PmpR family DNA-binding transcriptional regulator [Ehrlichia ruminantium]Q5FHN8.1 RecName: Full=Probable transcriptional regulatory protein ERGA_CDS_03720 [Ehrlichia ruminantium str. Gardel]Q5HBG4.1 RecName: Full=Probable transcriptional regulatory protein Erum3660/ERWE_CDS_03770 [Ehrlichia ruminantium str. Welgevonden]KYX00475.1 transcriptional regulator [Ehrlichia ruminantium]QLK50442.1 YebC/PmpR family DNA-binding transcriptional regulator [Ehrlichia ruminantium]QLK51367.1 YebC/PmpR